MFKPRESKRGDRPEAFLETDDSGPLCHALPYFQMEVERVLAGIPGIGGVKCTFDHGGNWQPDNMTVSAQRKLADRREFVRSRAGVYVEGE